MTGLPVNFAAATGACRNFGWWPTRPLLMLVMAVGLIACGADEGAPPTGPDGGDPTVAEGGPRVADARFDGTFVVTELIVDGRAVPLAVAPTLEIETEFGGLQVEAGCNTFFGSFTLDEDGSASFSVAGGSKRACDELQAQDRLVLDGLAAISSWVETSNGFRFEGPSDHAITVRR